MPQHTIALSALFSNQPVFTASFGRPEALKVTFSIQNQSNAIVRYILGAEVEAVQPRETVTHTECSRRPLSFEKAGQATARFTPQDGDRFVVRMGQERTVEVGVEHK